jgi:hypothetical protein
MESKSVSSKLGRVLLVLVVLVVVTVDMVMDVVLVVFMVVVVMVVVVVVVVYMCERQARTCWSGRIWNQSGNPMIQVSITVLSPEPRMRIGM